MEKIKLVIWDLDNTFWDGTLSEEGISFIDYHCNVVKELTRRGIMNSISSKNDFDKAKEVLQENGMWEYFIFPSINWEPKGQSIKQIIEACQLRPINSLFIDDNHLNLEEASFHCNKINTAPPSFIKEILSHPSLIGKNDTEHTRLAQYKLLEKKHTAQMRFSDNIEFLESCNIQLKIIDVNNKSKYIERIVELLNRTNQLNFTKKRVTEDEIIILLNTKSIETKVIRAKDKFGDYGIVGVYSYDTIENKLIHFTFSCRILNLGIPQYIFHKLNFPKLTIVPEISEKLDHSNPHWIKEMETDSAAKSPNVKPQKLKILFKGGCDLKQMMYYIPKRKFECIEETNYVSNSNFPIHQDHSVTLLNSLDISDKDKSYLIKSDFIPFIDNNYFNTKVFNSKYNCFIYSPLMDYTQVLYRHKKRNIRIAVGTEEHLWTTNDGADHIITHFKQLSINLNPSIFQEFKDVFEYEGLLSTEEFKNNIKRLKTLMPKNTLFIILNGTEQKSTSATETSQHLRHKEMNDAIDELITEDDTFCLLDVRKIVNSPSMLTDNIRHYQRAVYYKISQELLLILRNNLDSKTEASSKLRYYWSLSQKYSLKRRIKKIIQKHRGVCLNKTHSL